MNQADMSLFQFQTACRCFGSFPPKWLGGLQAGQFQAINLPHNKLMSRSGWVYKVLLQVRRARAWMPCMDTPSSGHPWMLRFSVRPHEVAVGPGKLEKQTLGRGGEWLTFHYSVAPNTPPCQIGLAVGNASGWQAFIIASGFAYQSCNMSLVHQTRCNQVCGHMNGGFQTAHLLSTACTDFQS